MFCNPTANSNPGHPRREAGEKQEFYQCSYCHKFPLLFRFNFLKPISNQNQIFSRVFRQAKMILHSKWKKVILDRLQTPPHKVNKVSTQISFEFIILKTFTFTSSWKISFHVNIIILWERFSWQSTLFQIHPDITHSRCGWYVKNAGQVSRYKARGVKKVKVSVSVGDTYHTYLST
jgi:hypothetical protein